MIFIVNQTEPETVEECGKVRFIDVVIDQRFPMVVLVESHTRVEEPFPHLDGCRVASVLFKKLFCCQKNIQPDGEREVVLPKAIMIMS